MSDIFYTVAGPAEGKFTEKMSKFLSFVFPVSSVQEARDCIASVSKRYYDARHVCWAYKIGVETPYCLSSDNGEPSGTAGKPILGQINSFNVTDVAVIVVRYFGGVKLGTSGLISAYREAARIALESADIRECHVMASIRFTYPYMAMNNVMKLIKQPGITIVSQTFDNSCDVEISVRKDDLSRLQSRLADIDGLTFAE